MRTRLLLVMASVACAFALASVAFADVQDFGADLEAAGIGTQATGLITVYDEADGSTQEYADLQKALDVVENRTTGEAITVTLPANSTYTLTPTDSANHGKLRIYSNTTLDLNGSTIVRSDAVIDDGMIYNYPIGFSSRGGGP